MSFLFNMLSLNTYVMYRTWQVPGTVGTDNKQNIVYPYAFLVIVLTNEEISMIWILDP